LPLASVCPHSALAVCRWLAHVKDIVSRSRNGAKCPAGYHKAHQAKRGTENPLVADSSPMRVIERPLPMWQGPLRCSGNI
jgi:hypothetical protein